MSGKNFITVCKSICGAWAFCSCTLLIGQVAARQLPDGKMAGRSVNGALHHKIIAPIGTPDGARRALRNRMNHAYGKLPLSFEPNHGQANRQVRFLSRGEGYTLFLTGSEAVLTLKKSNVRSQKSEEQLTADSRQFKVASHPRESGEPESKVDSRLRGNDKAASLAARHLPDATNNGQRTTDAALSIIMVGANPTAKVLGLDELQSKTNYFIGKDPKNWRTNVPNYAKVKYEGVYPGVDLIYYGNQRQLEYDFVLEPGADLNIITMALETEERTLGNGNSKLENGGVKPRFDVAHRPEREVEGPLQIAANGDLIIKTNGGKVRLHKPVVYQEQLTDHDNGQRATENGFLTANHKSAPIANSSTGVTFSPPAIELVLKLEPMTTPSRWSSIRC